MHLQFSPPPPPPHTLPKVAFRNFIFFFFRPLPPPFLSESDSHTHNFFPPLLHIFSHSDLIRSPPSSSVRNNLVTRVANETKVREKGCRREGARGGGERRAASTQPHTRYFQNKRKLAEGFSRPNRRSLRLADRWSPGWTRPPRVPVQWSACDK